MIRLCDCNPNAKLEDGLTPLHLACEVGCLETVRFLITEFNCDYTCKLEDGTSCLHISCRFGLLNVVEFLIKHCKHFTECKDLKGCTPLHEACTNGHLKIVKYLIDQCRCDPECENNSGHTPVYCAFLHDHQDILHYMIEKSLVCKTSVVNGDIIYHSVIENECSYKVIIYILTVINQSQKVFFYKNPIKYLHIACEHNRLETVEVLITKFKCDPLCKMDDDGTTCLHIACKHGHLKIVEYLIENHECDPMRGYCNGYTPVHYACINGHFDVVQYIVQKFPNNVSFASNGDSILHSALRNRHNEIVTYLIKKPDFNPDLINENCETILHLACDNEDVQMVQLLVSTNKINVDARDRNSKTALQRVKTWSNKAEILEVFTKYKERLYIPIIDSYTNVVVLGEPQAGKSSLIQVIRERSAGGNNCCYEYYLSMQHIKHVDQHTVGIVSYRLEHEEIGNIILHDLAGHPEFYSNHDEAIENLLKNNGGVIIITVSLEYWKKIKNILKDYREWLAVAAKLSRINNNISMITVASHADCVRDVNRRETLRLELIKECEAYFTGTEVVVLNCCKRGGGQLPRFLKLLQSACDQCCGTKTDTRTVTADDKHCSQLYAFLLETKCNIVKFNELKESLEKGKDYLKLVYDSNEKLCSALSSLHKVGLIKFLNNTRTQDECDSWIIIRTGELLNEMEKVFFIKKKRSGYQYR